jgi:hypothetical protein
MRIKVGGGRSPIHPILKKLKSSMGLFKRDRNGAEFGGEDFMQRIFEVQSCHQQAIKEVDLFVLRTDSMLADGILMDAYQTEARGGPENAVNLFIEMKLAKEELENAMFIYGMPKYGRGAPDLVSQLILNQDTYAEAIWLQFAYQCLAIGAAIFCHQNSQDYRIFDKHLHWKEGESTFGLLVELENDQYRELTYSEGNAIFGFERKKTHSEIRRHAETSVIQLNKLHKLRKKCLKEIDSLVPWILLKTDNPSLGTFNFEKPT